MNSKCQKILAASLAAFMSISFIPKIAGTEDVLLAAVEKNQDNTCLGTSGIANPVKPKRESSVWSGSIVYFGKYEGDPIRFRVLQKDSTVYTDNKALFLDSEAALFKDCFYFGRDDKNTWEDSDIREKLNDSFLSESFTELEQSAVATSTGNGNITYAPGSYEEYEYGSPVSIDDKVFLLDAGDITNESFGYYSHPGNVLMEGTEWKGNPHKGTRDIANHMKTMVNSEKSCWWWLRTAMGTNSGNWNYYSWGGMVDGCGDLHYNLVGNSIGIAPALNIDQSLILFSTIVNNGQFGKAGTEYKLTLNDSNLKIAVRDGKKITADGTKISVPYAIEGTNAETATRASVLILDKEFKTGNSNDANILYYDGLGGSFGKNSTGTFTLPATLNISDWGSKFFVYILAEDINGEKETDYASVPVKISAPASKTTPTPTKNPTPTPAAGKKSTWSQESGKWYYYDKNGSKVTGWYQVGSWYLFDKNGVMLTGWQQDGGKWYYLGNGGAMRTGWVQINGLWYYLDASGAMKTGWLKLGKVWYYLKADGSMAANEYCEGYWLNADGSWTYTAKASWYKNTSGWYYQDTAGWYAKNGTYKIDGKNYNFGKTGYCLNP